MKRGLVLGFFAGVGVTAWFGWKVLPGVIVHVMERVQVERG